MARREEDGRIRRGKRKEREREGQEEERKERRRMFRNSCQRDAHQYM